MWSFKQKFGNFSLLARNLFAACRSTATAGFVCFSQQNRYAFIDCQVNIQTHQEDQDAVLESVKMR